MEKNKCECERPDDNTCQYCDERESARILIEAKLYSDIETAIMEWSRDGDKTAGFLTRKISSIIRRSGYTLTKNSGWSTLPKIKDEYGNTDWRDTGEMGG